ncbi:2989_t:CDS:2, partial [Acaulospora colombiana]
PKLLFNSPQYQNLTQEMIIALLEKGLVQIGEVEIWMKVLEWGMKQNPEIANRSGGSLSSEDYRSLQRTLLKILPLIKFEKMSLKDFNEKIHRPKIQTFDVNVISTVGSFREWYQLNISPEIFEVMLKFMYSGRIDLNSEVDTQKILEYLHAADILWLYQLLEHLQLYLIHNRSRWLQQNFVH